MHVFETIGVPVDLSDRNEPSIRLALDLVDPEGGTVWLIHVIETIEGLEDNETKRFYAEMASRAEAVMKGWLSVLGNRGRSIRLRIASGHRAREILRQAEVIGCDLLVMRSHRIDRDHPSGGLGTLSHYTAVAADCPVLLTR